VDSTVYLVQGFSTQDVQITLSLITRRSMRTQWGTWTWMAKDKRIFFCDFTDIYWNLAFPQW
jgi:hypothetical protein